MRRILIIKLMTVLCVVGIAQMVGCIDDNNYCYNYRALLKDKLRSAEGQGIFVCQDLRDTTKFFRFDIRNESKFQSRNNGDTLFFKYITKTHCDCQCTNDTIIEAIKNNQ